MPAAAKNNFLALPPSRIRLLDKLGRLIAAEGFAHLKMADIASKIGCGRATLYRIAPTKEQLIVLCIHHFHRVLIEADKLFDGRGKPTSQILEELLHINLENGQPQSKAYCQDAESIVAVKTVVDQYRTDAVDLLTPIMERGIRRGEINAVSATAAAEFWVLNLDACFRPALHNLNSQQSLQQRAQVAMAYVHKAILI